MGGVCHESSHTTIPLGGETFFFLGVFFFGDLELRGGERLTLRRKRKAPSRSTGCCVGGEARRRRKRNAPSRSMFRVLMAKKTRDLVSMELTIVNCLVEWLTLGEIARLHEALCDHTPPSKEIAHVIRDRLCLSKTPRASATVITLLSSYMSNSRVRCRECGTGTQRQCKVCFTCANDATSYRSMVSRNDLRRLSDGWIVRERHLRKICATLHVVAMTSTGGHFYWRRESFVAFSNPIPID